MLLPTVSIYIAIKIEDEFCDLRIYNQAEMVAKIRNISEVYITTQIIEGLTIS